MVDSSWDNGGGSGTERSGAFPTWMKVTLVLGLALAVLVAFGVGTAQRRTRELWPPVAKVLQELSTEEGARSFLKEHPEALEKGDTEAEFLQKLRSWRGNFGTLPQGIPGTKDGFRVMSRPLGWRAYVRGQGEAWLGVQVVGKKLQVFPAENRAERARLAARMERAWKRALGAQVLELANLLQSEEGSRRLFQENPGLAERFPTQDAFLAEAARLRPELKGLPQNAAELAPEKISTRIQGSPFGMQVEVHLGLLGGKKVRMVWKQDRLGNVGLE